MSRPAVLYRVKGTREYVSPVASASMTGGDVPMAAVPGPYDVAGGSGRRSRAWIVGSYGPNSAINYGLDELRRKSRDQARKNPYAAAAIDSLTSNLIGTGIVPKSAAPNEAFKKQVTDLWLRWTDEADATGALDFYGLQALAVRGMIEGGETFTRLRIRRLTDGLSVPLQLQLIEGDQCPHMKTDPQKLIRQGIQYNAIGQREGYYLYKEHPGDLTFGSLADAFEPVLVPAAEIAHLYRPLRPGQDRGEPWLARALKTLYDLDGYLDAELVRKKTAAMLVGFVKRAIGGDDPVGAGPVEGDGAASLSLEPGTIHFLLEGEDITFSEPKDVGPNFDAFVRQALRGVSTAVGALYEELTGDYSTLNDRTLRAALTAFRRSMEMLQHQLVVFQFCRKVWKTWMDLALLSGALRIPVGMTREEAYAVEWLPARWPYIHPVQDIEAQEREIQAGFATRSQKVSERGYDAAAIDQENADDNARADQLGVVYTSDGRQKAKGAATAAAAPSDDQPGEDAEDSQAA